MNDDIGPQILAELRRQTRYTQLALGAMAFVIVGYCVFSYFRARALHSPPAERPISWSQIDKAMDQLDYQKALTLVRELIARNPNYYYGHQYLGHVYLAMGDLAQAETEYTRAYEMFPSEETQKDVKALQKRKGKYPAADVSP